MDNDQALGYIIVLGSLAAIVIYFWLIFFTPWTWRVIQVSAFLAVIGVLVIIGWIGYTMMTTPPPMPIEDFDFDFDEKSSNEDEVAPAESNDEEEPLEET